MNRTQKTILESYKGFLAQNIIWTDNLYSYLESYGLLTESMLDDIKEVANKYEKADRLIQWLFVREKKNFYSLCDILQLSGHTFVADFLREEGDFKLMSFFSLALEKLSKYKGLEIEINKMCGKKTVTVPIGIGVLGLLRKVMDNFTKNVPEKSSEVIDTKALFEILPSLERCLGQQQRTEVEHFIKQKVKELKFRCLWKERNAEKEKSMEAKNLQLEQSYEYHVALKSKEIEISELKGEIESCDQEKERLGKEINHLKKEVKGVQERCDGEVELQIRHNRANESSLKRLGDQLEISKNLLRNTHQQITTILQLQPRSCDKDLIAIMENEFAFFLDDFGKFLHRFRELEEFQKEYESLKAERDWVLTHLGFNPQDKDAPTLTQAYREFAVRTDDNIAKLKSELSIKKKVLCKQEAEIQGLSIERGSENGGKHSKTLSCWQRFLFAVLRRQVRKLQGENWEKNELIKLISKENAILNEQKMERRAIMSAGQISREYTEKPANKNSPDTDKEKTLQNSHPQVKVTFPEEVQTAGSTKTENSSIIIQNVPILNTNSSQRPFSKQTTSKAFDKKIKSSQISEAALGGGLTASSVKMVSRQNGRKRLV